MPCPYGTMRVLRGRSAADAYVGNDAAMSADMIHQRVTNWDPGPQTDGSEIGVAAAVWRRWGLIAAFTLIGTLGAFLLCRLITPAYVSSATVLINPREPQRTVVNTDPLSFTAPTEEAVRKNETAVIKSRRLAEEVIAQLGLERIPEFNPGRRATSWLGQLMARAGAVFGSVRSTPMPGLDPVVDQFLARLLTKSTEASRIIEIEFRSESPRLAALIANTTAEQYIRQRRQQDVANAEAASRSLQKEIEAVNLKIRDAELATERMRSEHGLLPAANLKIITEQLTDLNRQSVIASGERASAEAQLANLDAARKSQKADASAAVLNSPLIRQMQADLAQRAAKAAGLSVYYLENTPRVVQARTEYRELLARIDTEIDKIAQSIRGELAVANAKEAELQKMVEQTNSQVTKATQSDIDVRAYQREADAYKALMIQLVTRLDDTQAQMNREEPGARVISSATIPRFPKYPPTLAVVAAGLLLSMTGGTLLAVALERNDGSIRSTIQLRHMTSARVLGAIPLQKWARRVHRSPAARVLKERRSMFAESLRSVWLQIELPRKERVRTLLVTSSLPGEGKSSLATALARLLAVRGLKAVIVDADLRYPSVHQLFGLSRSPGLADVLEATKTLGDVIQKDVESGAFVVAAGSTSGSPTDVLQSARMSLVLTDLAAGFDVVIIDTPPVLAVPDAGILARQVDMTALVVRWGATKAHTVATSLQRLQDFDAHIGIVLTMVDQKRYAHYGFADAEIFSDRLQKYYSS